MEEQDERRVKCKRTNTYVVQVQSGRERRARMLIERMLPDGLVDEVFVPTYVKQVKRAGEWCEQESLLVPGYLYLISDDIDEVVRNLRAVPTLTKVLKTEARFVPLSEEESNWLQRLTKPGKRTIDISTGMIEGDDVHIVSGPLKGLEAFVRRIDRHRRTAEIEFRIMGRSTRIRVGLEIVQKHK